MGNTHHLPVHPTSALQWDTMWAWSQAPILSGFWLLHMCSTQFFTGETWQSSQNAPELGHDATELKISMELTWKCLTKMTTNFACLAWKFFNLILE